MKLDRTELMNFARLLVTDACLTRPTDVSPVMKWNRAYRGRAMYCRLAVNHEGTHRYAAVPLDAAPMLDQLLGERWVEERGCDRAR